MTTGTGDRLTRRDLLAGVGAALVAGPFVPRAAVALRQEATPEASASADADAAIARLAVYPPIGICRVGNSGEWFLAPEVPGLPPVPDGRYKSAPDEVLKQVQRFRVYAFDADGNVLREITAEEAEIGWTVHVANTKAAWYGFANPLDNGDAAPGIPGKRRNDAVTDPRSRAANLVIDPGPREIAGAGRNAGGDDPAFAMTGRFWSTLDVPLGHLRTDEAGRLLVFPADGVSRSAVPNNPITNFADNDGWHDDWCDGPVRASVTFADGRELAADPAWVACVGPDWAPEIPPVVSLHDVMTGVAIDAGWLEASARPVSFRQHVYPIFRSLALMAWVSSAANLASGWLDKDALDDPMTLERLVDPSPDNAAFRAQVLALIRDPSSDDQQQYALPYMLGDGVNYAESPLRWLKMPRHQYDLLVAWADGDFVADLDPAAPEPALALDDLPLADRPDALTRAALLPCSGGAFHPGVELTWPLRHRELFREPYRIAHATDRDPSLLQDLGMLLTPELAFAGTDATPPPIGPQAPGDLTRWMGLPWQGDAFSCQQVVFPNDFPIASWWPALVPIDVLPQVYYDRLMDPALPADNRVTLFENRMLWSRGVAGIGYHAEASYLDGVMNMIALWTRMGFVVGRPGPTDPDAPELIPDRLQVEVDRGDLDVQAAPAPMP